KTGLERRLGDRRNCAEVAHPIIARERLLAALGSHDRELLPLLVARQVRADWRPGMAAVGGFEQLVAAVVDDFRVVRREEHGRAPVEPVRFLRVLRHWPQSLLMSRREVSLLRLSTLD